MMMNNESNGGITDDWCRDSANTTNGETRFRKFMEE